MQRPKTLSEYLYLIDQALIEVDEMRNIIAYEMDGDERPADFLIPLEAELKRLKEAIETDSYEFRDEDLPYMSAIPTREFDRLPFKYLLDQINSTHRQGLESAD